MTIEEAKLILQAYRAIEEDDNDPFFSEALALAQADSRLGEWLREQQKFDDSMRDALRSLFPPADLRGSILAAKNAPKIARHSHFQSLLFSSLVIAASIVLILAGVLFLGQETTPSMTVASFAREALDIKEQNRITLGIKNTDPQQLCKWLAERGAPHDFIIPPGLRGISSLGCQSYLVNGKKVSLICFDLGNNQVAHLFIVERSALADAVSESRPQVRSEGGLAFATWTDGNKSFLLTGDNVTEETLRRLI